LALGSESVLFLAVLLSDRLYCDSPRFMTCYLRCCQQVFLTIDRILYHNALNYCFGRTSCSTTSSPFFLTRVANFPTYANKRRGYHVLKVYIEAANNFRTGFWGHAVLKRSMVSQYLRGSLSSFLPNQNARGLSRTATSHRAESEKVWRAKRSKTQEPVLTVAFDSQIPANDLST
jgi:hypothetical protein